MYTILAVFCQGLFYTFIFRSWNYNLQPLDALLNKKLALITQRGYDVYCVALKKRLTPFSSFLRFRIYLFSVLGTEKQARGYTK